MVFYLSKIFWFLVAPTNFAIAVAAVGAVLLYAGRRRLGRSLVAVGAAVLVLIGASPLPKVVMRSLEDRFPRAAEGPIEGLVVLGGAANVVRGEIAFNDAASRMMVAVGLALRHPNAKVVFSGGDSGFFERGEETEAGAALALFALAGIPAERIVAEDRSRNTRENALFTRELLRPKPGERWVLVTSAFHMPRAIACFRAVGLDLEAYPVDFRTAGQSIDYWRPFARFSDGARMADLGVKEWIGIVAYRLAGYTDELLPSPRTPSPSPGASTSR